MIKDPIQFPHDFLWGASTSAFQVEGAAADDGKGRTISDVRSEKNKDKQMDTSVSVGHYHHYKEDVQLMKELGMKSYRFSISWARIFPKGYENEPNQKGVDFYHNLLDELIKNGIEPIVTLYHFDLPMGLIEDYGGWLSRNTIDAFADYAEFMFKEFGSKVKYWLSINEQAVMSGNPGMIGIEGSDPFELNQKCQQASYHMFLAQAKAFALCHQILPNAKIGPAVSYITVLPASMASKDVLECKRLENYVSFSQMDTAVNGKIPQYYLNMLEEQGVKLETLPEDKDILKNGTADYLGLNWYCTMTGKYKKSEKVKSPLERAINLELVKNETLKSTEWGWTNDPIGFRYALLSCYERYQLPIIITENGWSSKDELVDGQIHDVNRIAYLNDHIYQMHLAMTKDGVDIISYNPWSFIDLLSVNDGMEKRYGLVYVDRDNFNEKELKRYKKDSFHFYSEVIRNNGSVVKAPEEY